MLSLADLQSAFGAVSLGGDAAKLAPVLIADGFRPEQRLQIHTNNTTLLLSDVLANTYPVIKKLVGNDFFEAVARLYVRAQPPRSPCLFEYGAGFAEYLTTVPAASGLPYLADVARLEWAWNESFYAPDAPPLSAAALARIAPEAYNDLTFTPHPSLRLVASAYPITDIWAVNQCGADSDARVDLDEGGQFVAVLRAHASVTFIELCQGGFEMVSRLCAGERLADALSSAQRKVPDFDPTSTLTLALSAGLFHAFDL